MKYSLFLVPSLLTFASCGSYDLGSVRPTELALETESPTWDKDIRFLIQVKCMNCHAQPKPVHAPSTTPVLALDDLSQFQAVFAARTRARVFHSSDNPMPPNYGTPLSLTEKTALKSYLTSILGPDTTVTTTTTTTTTTQNTNTTPSLSSAYVQNCQVCHGATGMGGIGPKLVGTSISQATYLSKIRDGVTGTSMPKFTATQISDNDVTNDHAFFTKK